MRCKTILYEQKCEKLRELTSNDKETETWSAWNNSKKWEIRNGVLDGLK